MLFRIPKDRKSAPVPVKASSLTNQGWNEKALEHYLREHLATLIGEDLWIIGQSRPFQPEVDLLALDRHGDLWFFELKKIATEPENLLQVMRYSQSASGWDINELDGVLRQHLRNKTQPCDSLIVEFCRHFAYLSPSAVQEWEQRIGRVHHLVVIADGADESAIQTVTHWQNHGLDIQLWPYRVHDNDCRTFHLELSDLVIKGRQISKSDGGVFLVNTCRFNKPTSPHEEFMLQNQCAVAIVDPWTFKINRILAGSKVMLYANRTGIIAIGIATAEKRNDVITGEKARLVKLREFKTLVKPLRAEEISSLAGVANYPLRQTVRRLPDELGDKVWEACLKRT